MKKAVADENNPRTIDDEVVMLLYDNHFIRRVKECRGICDPVCK